ncbi:MAG: hypothetical protein EP338_06915 [Bacteroidetes bacterium]|nr:MAG: hypothetical protein EP338_06915 [Bacteroidota bacterium]
MKMINEVCSFQPWTKEQLGYFLTHREGEERLGDHVSLGNETSGKAKYLILGVSEDLGPQANEGRPGSITAFESFVGKFVNMQSNQFLNGSEFQILGELRTNVQFDPSRKKELVREIDLAVEQLLEPWIAQRMIPILIGGGHNNAYPLICSVSKVCKTPISVVNCDPHADYRATDYRHSGNSFSWARKEGKMDFYAVLGLHESYNNQYILDRLKEDACMATYFDDYLEDPEAFVKDIQKVLEICKGKVIGVELDMDAIAYMPSSAMTPSGISLEQARMYLRKMGRSDACYLHLPEAAPQTADEKSLVGKALAYLVSDFVKAHMKGKP